MMTQFFQVLKLTKSQAVSMDKFYDDSILSGTKTDPVFRCPHVVFYDDSILSGTKTWIYAR